MTKLYSATGKKIQRQMTMRNKNIISYLKRHKRSTLADIANKIQLPFSTVLVELKYLNKQGFVGIMDVDSEMEDKELIEAMNRVKPKPIKKRRRKTKKKKQKLKDLAKDEYTADLDRWMK